MAAMEPAVPQLRLPQPGLSALPVRSAGIQRSASRSFCSSAAVSMTVLVLHTSRYSRARFRIKGNQVQRRPVGVSSRAEPEGASNYKNLEAFLEAQRESPPVTDPLGGPLTPYNDSPVDWIFIAVFRQVMSGVANWQSPLAFWGPEAYDGMLEVAHAQQWGKTLQQTEDSAMSVIDSLLPEEGKARFRTALKADQFGTELNALITAVFFPFMVGKCELEERKHEDLEQIPEGEAWKCAVKIEKCRWLERYRQLFKDRLDPHGRPVPYPNFRRYVVQVLNGIDPDPAAQEMMLEQFVAEAKSARAVFHVPSFASTADKAFLPHLSFHVNSFPRIPDEESLAMPEMRAAMGGA